MKKLFTVDDLLVAFISAVGWGLGAIIPAHEGANIWICFLCSTVAGLLMDGLGRRLIRQKAVQKSALLKWGIGLGFAALFLIADRISVHYYQESLLKSLKEQYFYVIAYPIFGFVLALLVFCIKRYLIRKRFGRGEEGLKVDESDIRFFRELNGSNKKLGVIYNRKYAVKTRTGVFVGEKDGKTVCFKGIPYATAERFRAPVPCPASDAVYSAQYFGPSPVQRIDPTNPQGYHQQSEDCLYLNIWTPNDRTPGKKVIVALQTGDFEIGSAVNPVLWGDRYVQSHDDVIFVSVGYRISLFGYLDVTGIPGGEAYPDSGELYFLDTLCALRWIRENIAAFGGDPACITLFGLGLGGFMAAALSVSPEARGLFQ